MVKVFSSDSTLQPTAKMSGQEVSGSNHETDVVMPVYKAWSLLVSVSSC